MSDIKIIREFKGLKISMCMMGNDGAFDYEFTIDGEILPMVQIGFITHYADGSELILNNFKNEDIGSEIYATLSYGRVVQTEDDEEPSYIEVFESGVNYGMYNLEDDDYKMLIYDKKEMVDILYSMANECLKEYNSKNIYLYTVKECIYEESFEETDFHKIVGDKDVKKGIKDIVKHIIYTDGVTPKTHTGVVLRDDNESEVYIDNLTLPINLCLLYPQGYTKIMVSKLEAEI